MKDTKEVIVIDKKELQGKGYKTLEKVLEDLPSINVGLTGWGDIDIRGQGEGQAHRNIQVMLDGAPITTLTSHPFMNNYNYIPVDNIEKIEIIPGGGSVVYGSGAAGGIINITTNLRNMDKPVKSISMTYGQKEKVGSLALGGAISDKTSYQLNYTQTDKDLYFNNTYRKSKYFSGGVSHKPDNSQRISLRYSHLEEDGQYIANVTNQNFKKYGKNYVPKSYYKTVGIDSAGKKIQRLFSGYLNADRTLDMLSVNYAKNFDEHNRLSLDVFYNTGYFNNNSFGDKKMDHSTVGVKVKFDHAYGKQQQHSVLVGLDWYQQKSDLAYDDYVGGYSGKPLKVHPLKFSYDKKVQAMYLSNTLKYGKLSLVQGVRLEQTQWAYDKEAAKSAGKGNRKTNNIATELAAAYDYRDTGKVYARYERGFTHPDGIQASDDFGTIILPSIVREEIYDLYELGWREKIGISNLSVTAFYSNTENQIDRFLTFSRTGFIRRSLNLYDTSRRGLDVALSQKVGKWSFREGYTYLKGKSAYNDSGREFVLNSGKDLIDWTQQSLKAVPKHKVVLKAQYRPDDRWTLGAQYNYVGRYNNFTEDEDAKDNEIGSHKMIDFDVSYKANANFTVYLGVKNAFNEKYAYYMGENSGGYYSLIPGDERMFYMTTSYKF